MNEEKIIKTFTTKSGAQAIIRSMERTDASAACRFINTISQENTFVQFAGEHISLEDEQRYIDSELELIGTENAVKLVCLVDGTIAGIADVHRNVATRTRKLHVGTFGLIINKEFRGQGIGETLMRTTIEEAARSMPGLKMIYLECFAINEPALSLYKKVGFNEVGRVPGALYRQGQYIDEVIMVKQL
jgi:RimJ/RimL family protein N-acetyltransferase